MEAIAAAFLVPLIGMSSLGTFFSRIEMVFVLTLKFNVARRETVVDVFKGLAKFIIPLITLEIFLLLLDVAQLIAEMVRKFSTLCLPVRLISLGLTAYGLTRELGPFYEVAQKFTSPFPKGDRKARQTSIFSHLFAAVVVGAAIIVTLALPWSGVLLGFAAIAGYLGGGIIVMLGFYLAKRRR